MYSRIHGSSHGTHRMGGLFGMDPGETRTGIRLHDPRARLRAPLEPQRRQAVDWNRRFQHCAGLVRMSKRPFSSDDPYSHRGSTQSCPGLVGTPGAISEEVALEYACCGCGGPRTHHGPSNGPPAQGHSHVACSERAARATVQRQEPLVAAL